MSDHRRPRPGRVRRTLIVAAVVVVIGVLAGCASEAPPISSRVPAAVTNEDRVVYVALGGNESLTRGLDDAVRNAWPQLVFAALPRSAVYVNLAARDASVQSVLDVQVPTAIDLHPTVVTIWLGSSEANDQSDAAFAAGLTDVVHKMQGAGATRVLLLSRPAGTAGPASRYAEVIRQIAGDTDSVFVPIDGPGRSRDPETHRQIAAAVKAQLTS
jgi:hypothetical protein